MECKGNINSAKYVSILQEGLLPIFSSGKMNKFESLFMENGAPCHSARAKQNWLSQNGINKLPWPSQSPDMNPIENPMQLYEFTLSYSKTIVTCKHKVICFNNRKILMLVFILFCHVCVQYDAVCF